MYRCQGEISLPMLSFTCTPDSCWRPFILQAKEEAWSEKATCVQQRPHPDISVIPACSPDSRDSEKCKQLRLARRLHGSEGGQVIIFGLRIETWALSHYRPVPESPIPQQIVSIMALWNFINMERADGVFPKNLQALKWKAFLYFPERHLLVII